MWLIFSGVVTGMIVGDGYTLKFSSNKTFHGLMMCINTSSFNFLWNLNSGASLCTISFFANFWHQISIHGVLLLLPKIGNLRLLVNFLISPKIGKYSPFIESSSPSSGFVLTLPTTTPKKFHYSRSGRQIFKYSRKFQKIETNDSFPF